MKTCDGCGLRLWSTDKGVCPTCKPEENLAVYGLIKPLKQTVLEVQKPSKIVETLEDVADDTTDYSLEGAVKLHVLKVYEESGKHKTKAAKRLGVTVKTLYNHLDRYGVV